MVKNTASDGVPVELALPVAIGGSAGVVAEAERIGMVCEVKVAGSPPAVVLGPPAPPPPPPPAPVPVASPEVTKVASTEPDLVEVGLVGLGGGDSASVDVAAACVDGLGASEDSAGVVVGVGGCSFEVCTGLVAGSIVAVAVTVVAAGGVTVTVSLGITPSAGEVD